NTRGAKINPQDTVRVYKIRNDGNSHSRRGCTGSAVRNTDAAGAVESNQISLDRVLVREGVNKDAAKPIAEPVVAAHVNTNIVAENQIQGHWLVGTHANPMAVITGDDIPGGGGRPSNRITGGIVVNNDTFVRVTQRRRAGNIGPDQVALHKATGGAGEIKIGAEINPGRIVPGDEVTRA